MSSTSLKSKTIRGVGWSWIGNASSQVVRLITVVAMARLLTPEDYGIYAILLIFTGFFGILSSVGLGQVIIYLDDPKPRMLSSVFYLNLIVGASLAALFITLAAPISGFFQDDSLLHYIPAIAALFPINSLITLQQALFEKQLRFKLLAISDLTSLTAGAGAGIASALAGLGVWSFIVMVLSTALTKALILWIVSSWRPTLAFAFSDIRSVWSYCFNITGFALINYFSRNADQFLIGRYIGTTALGTYSLAYQIMIYPLATISWVVTRVLFPALSTIKHDNSRLKALYIKIIRFIALLTFPMMIGVMVVAGDFVPAVLGSQWTTVIPVLIILAPIGLMQSIATTAGTIYTVKGTTNIMFRVGFVNSIVTVIAFVIGLQYGIVGVAAAYGIANLVMLYPNLHYAWRQIDLRLTDGLLALTPYLIAAMVMATAVALIAQTQWNASMPHQSRLLIQIITGFLVYAIVLLSVFRRDSLGLLSDILNGLRNR